VTGSLAKYVILIEIVYTALRGNGWHLYESLSVRSRLSSVAYSLELSVVTVWSDCDFRLFRVLSTTLSRVLSVSIMYG
jgi:hypothetical protein